MMAAMTPDYASPEQVRGAHTTAASDIYSLGVLLYELLAGERPYRLSGTAIEETLEVVCRKDPPKPSSRAGEIPEDLDAIVLKAMRKDPAGRYSSAREMSDDIERYLTGKPVGARRGTFAYVSRKFIRRHKAWVGAGAAALVLLIAGTAAIAWQARIANEQRAIAQRHFDEVRKLANSVIFDLHDGIAQLPGSTPVRKRLVDRALEYLDALAKDAPGDLALQLDLATAYTRVGDVQGNPSQSNLGDFQGALASYEKARMLAERVQAHNLDSLPAASLLLRLYGSLQALQMFLRNWPASLENAQRQLALAEDLSRRAPGDQKRQRAAGIALDSMALALSGLEKPEFVEYRLRALEVFQGLLKANPTSDNDRRNVALEHKYLATHYLGTALDRALTHLHAARELDQQRVADNPSDRYAKLDLSFDLSQDASYFRMKGDIAAALRSMKEVLRIREELLLADPADARLQDRVHYARRMVASLMLAKGDAKDALRVFGEVRAPLEARLAKTPNDAHSRSEVAAVLAGVALSKVALGLGAAACPEARRASAMFERLQQEGRLSADDQEARNTLERKAGGCFQDSAPPAKSR
jgi:non-specific serine/threonine protein kinase/serine/threonine-protein kinase